MPRIFLSPSTQEGNPYIIGGNEEYYMNLVADAMEPYLRSSGIEFTRNNRNQSTSQAIRDSNAGNYDLHLALHSNAAPPANSGNVRGTDVYYYPTSTAGKRAATIIADNFKKIYPIPSRVRTVPTTTLGEIRLVRAPSVLVEIAYHDNVEDATWIRDNIDNIAVNLVQSLTQYFGIPFVPPSGSGTRYGVVTTQSTALNIRARPNLMAPIVAKAPKGAEILVLGETGEWYVVNFNGTEGYARSQYITIT